MRNSRRRRNAYPSKPNPKTVLDQLAERVLQDNFVAKALGMPPKHPIPTIEELEKAIENEDSEHTRPPASDL